VRAKAAVPLLGFTVQTGLNPSKVTIGESDEVTPLPIESWSLALRRGYDGPAATGAQAEVVENEQIGASKGFDEAWMTPIASSERQVVT
jgi:hypothetical protein